MNPATRATKSVELTAVVFPVDDEARRQAALGKGGGDRVRLVPHHDDHVVDARVEKRLHDAGEKRVAVAGRQARLGPAHPGRAARGEHDGGDHGRHVIESRP